MSRLFNTKAAKLRRFLGLVLFSALIGLGLSIEMVQDWSSWLGALLIVFAGLGLAAWLTISGRQLNAPPAS